MFCPKCGSTLNDVTKICNSCGYNASEVVSNAIVNDNVVNTIKTNVKPNNHTSYTSKSKEKNIFLMVIYIGLAAIVLAMCFMGAKNIVEAGKEIMTIQSVGGKTLEEAYYAELGTLYAGYAIVVRAIGISFASILVMLGIKQ